MKGHRPAEYESSAYITFGTDSRVREGSIAMTATAAKHIEIDVIDDLVRVSLGESVTELRLDGCVFLRKLPLVLAESCHLFLLKVATPSWRMEAVFSV